jgi:hypothetical protein
MIALLGAQRALPVDGLRPRINELWNKSFGRGIIEDKELKELIKSRRDDFAMDTGYRVPRDQDLDD